MTARIPMLHWGQATMFHALTELLRALCERHRSPMRSDRPIAR
jgi:hypothetical protein